LMSSNWNIHPFPLNKLISGMDLLYQGDYLIE
jgi:hypothetical protein